MHEEIRDMRCKNCVHMIPTKHLDNGEWKWFYICGVFANEENGWAITVTPEDWCEMFVRKENKNDNFPEKV